MNTPAQLVLVTLGLIIVMWLLITVQAYLYRRSIRKSKAKPYREHLILKSSGGGG